MEQRYNTDHSYSEASSYPFSNRTALELLRDYKDNLPGNDGLPASVGKLEKILTLLQDQR